MVLGGIVSKTHNKQILSPAKKLAATSPRCAAFRAIFGRYVMYAAARKVRSESQCVQVVVCRC